MGYTKLFTEIIMSTVWREPNHVRLLWITMLAMKDRWHVVNASLPGLADSARITMDECVEALGVLSSPDKYSRTVEHEGRRIEACDGGWIILNGEKYRNKMSLDERREYQRIKQAEYRARKKSVKSCLQKSQQFTHTDTDTDTDTKPKEKAPPAKKRKTKKFKKPTINDVKDYCAERSNNVDAEKFVDYYTSNGWKVGKNPMKDWKAAVRTWEKNIHEKAGTDGRSRAKKFSDTLDEIAREDIEKNGYTDFVG